MASGCVPVEEGGQDLDGRSSNSYIIRFIAGL